jgi:hypothetical protein
MSHPKPPPEDMPPGQVRIADLLRALSLAAELAVGLAAEHAVRSCYLGVRIADRLQVPLDQQAGLLSVPALVLCSFPRRECVRITGRRSAMSSCIASYGVWAPQAVASESSSASATACCRVTMRPSSRAA